MDRPRRPNARLRSLMPDAPISAPAPHASEALARYGEPGPGLRSVSYALRVLLRRPALRRAFALARAREASARRDAERALEDLGAALTRQPQAEGLRPLWQLLRKARDEHPANRQAGQRDPEAYRATLSALAAQAIGRGVAQPICADEAAAAEARLVALRGRRERVALLETALASADRRTVRAGAAYLFAIAALAALTSLILAFR